MRQTRARFQHGFTALELAVSVSVVLVFAGVLLERMLFYQELAEKARMELEVTTLKLALQARIGTQITEHQPVDYPAMARGNPVRWLDAPMAGLSRGARSRRRRSCCPAAPGTSTSRRWSSCTCRGWTCI